MVNLIYLHNGYLYVGGYGHEKNTICFCNTDYVIAGDGLWK